MAYLSRANHRLAPGALARLRRSAEGDSSEPTASFVAVAAAAAAAVMHCLLFSSFASFRHNALGHAVLPDCAHFLFWACSPRLLPAAALYRPSLGF